MLGAIHLVLALPATGGSSFHLLHLLCLAVDPSSSLDRALRSIKTETWLCEKYYCTIETIIPPSVSSNQHSVSVNAQAFYQHAIISLPIWHPSRRVVVPSIQQEKCSMLLVYAPPKQASTFFFVCGQVSPDFDRAASRLFTCRKTSKHHQSVESVSQSAPTKQITKKDKQTTTRGLI